MGANHQQLAAVLDAAQRLLSARQDQMLTAEEWERLASAVEGATEPPVPPSATRRFERDDAGGVAVLVMHGGRELARRAVLADHLLAVAEYAECQRKPFLIDEVHSDLDFILPRADIRAALEFLVDRGLVQRDDIAYAAAREGIAGSAMSAMRALPACAGREG